MEFTRLTSLEEVKDLVDWHNKNSSFVVIDCEGTCKEVRQATLLDVQLSGKFSDSAAIFDVHYADAILGLDPSIFLVGHNYKWDAHILFRHGIDLLDRTWRDTILLGHLLDENRDSYSLDSYIKENWNDNYKEEFWKKYKGYQQAPEEEKIVYACKDIVYTGRLYRDFVQQLTGDSIPGSLIDHVHRLQSSLIRTEIEGIRIDQPYLEELGIGLKRRIDELDPQMRGLVKDQIDIIELDLWQKEIEKFKTPAKKASIPRPEFNWSSTQQLQRLLYSELKLTVQKKNKKVTTDADGLDKLKDEHPLIPLLLQYRQYPTIYNTFICGTLEKQDQGRIYPEFRVNGTVGSRISHSNPNMGNIPAEGGIKGIFVPNEGEVLSEFDYSQLEVCLEAHLTQDKNLLDIVMNGASKHDITASNLKIERSLAKTVNFAMQYWCTYHKLAKLLKCSTQEAQYVWNKYWETYSGPAKLKRETDALIDAGKPLVDLFGRKRRFQVRHRDTWDKDYRSGYNFRVQSPGGQLMNNSFYKANEWLRSTGYGRGILTVHDSGLFGCKPAHLEVVSKEVERFMVNEGVLIDLTVPLSVTANVGMSRWED